MTFPLRLRAEEPDCYRPDITDGFESVVAWIYRARLRKMRGLHRKFNPKNHKWTREICYLMYSVVVNPVYQLYLILKQVEHDVRHWMKKIYRKNFARRSRDIPTPREVETRTEKKRSKNAVKPLPKVRPRTLTLTKHGTDWTTQQQMEWRKKKNFHVEQRQETIDQLGKCDFYKFPFEIREQIWKYAFGGHHIHIVKKKGRLGNIICPAGDPTNPNWRDLCVMQRDEDGFCKPSAWPPDIRLLSVVGSCRQMHVCWPVSFVVLTNWLHYSYSETIEFLYVLNTFSFDEFDTLLLFLDNLLPHRRQLISSIHFSYDFIPRVSAWPWRQTGQFAQIYKPKYDTPNTWDDCCTILNSLPSLQSLVVTTPLFKYNPWNLGETVVGNVGDFVHSLNGVHVRGHFSLAWQDLPFGFQYGQSWWNLNEDDNALRKNFEIRKIMKHDNLELLTFFVPFNVRCLHCPTPSIIRKGSRGFAEAIMRGVSSPISPPHRMEPLTDPETTRYWTFHTGCGGWIEFQYEWGKRRWSVTQGAQEITDEEADVHFKANKGWKLEDESAHERLQGLTIKSHPSIGAYSTDISGRAIDAPTRDLIYQWAGWRTPNWSPPPMPLLPATYYPL